jgi:agmatinase
VDTQETDLDERMHTCPWFHATNMENAPAKNLVQLGHWRLAGAPSGGQGLPRAGNQHPHRHRHHRNGAGCSGGLRDLEHALDGTDCVWISFDIDCIDAGFVPGTGWPEPGGLLPREALYLLGKRIIQKATVCGIEVVEVSPPYDVSDMTALMATRVICDAMAHLVLSGQLPRQEKPAYIHEAANMNVDVAWT